METESGKAQVRAHETAFDERCKVRDGKIERLKDILASGGRGSSNLLDTRLDLLVQEGFLDEAGKSFWRDPVALNDGRGSWRAEYDAAVQALDAEIAATIAQLEAWNSTALPVTKEVAEKPLPDPLEPLKTIYESQFSSQIHASQMPLWSSFMRGLSQDQKADLTAIITGAAKWGVIYERNCLGGPKLVLNVAGLRTSKGSGSFPRRVEFPLYF